MEHFAAECGKDFGRQRVKAGAGTGNDENAFDCFFKTECLYSAITKWRAWPCYCKCYCKAFRMTKIRISDGFFQCLVYCLNLCSCTSHPSTSSTNCLFLCSLTPWLICKTKPRPLWSLTLAKKVHQGSVTFTNFPSSTDSLAAPLPPGN